MDMTLIILIFFFWFWIWFCLVMEEHKGNMKSDMPGEKFTLKKNSLLFPSFTNGPNERNDGQTQSTHSEKTEYFRLCLSYEVKLERPKRDLRVTLEWHKIPDSDLRDLRETWDIPEPESWRLRLLDKLRPDARTQILTPWAPYKAKKY